MNTTNKSKYDYDLIIIGAGVGGHGAAIHAAESGLKTAIVEGVVSSGGKSARYEERGPFETSRDHRGER